MKIEWKACFRIGLSVFVLYLGIHYWPSVSCFLSMVLGAAFPLLVGGIIAYVINILMSFYEGHFFPRAKSRALQRSRRSLCMLGAILTLILAVVLVVVLIVPQLAACTSLLLAEIPPALGRLMNSLKESGMLTETLAGFDPETMDWQAIGMRALQFLSSGIGGAVGVVTGTVSTAVTVFLSVIFAVYLLGGKDRLLRQTRRVMNSYMKPAAYQKTCYVLSVLNDGFHRYIVGQCTEAVILGSLCVVGMMLFRFPYAAMIGTLIGFTALIPIAGAYIGAGVGAFMILTVSPVQAIGFLVFIVILQQLEGNLIFPRVVGSSIGLPGIWVLAAVTVGGSLIGIFGMLLAVPLAAAAYRLLREDVKRREGLAGIERT